MSALFIVLGVLAYLFIGGAAGYRVYLWRKSVCVTCSGGRTHYSDGYHQGPSIAAGAMWPFAIPVLAGVLIAGWVGAREDRAVRREKRKEADHNRRMKELEAERDMTMESVRFLVENGIKADVPGLYDGGVR